MMPGNKDHELAEEFLKVVRTTVFEFIISRKFPGQLVLRIFFLDMNASVISPLLDGSLGVNEDQSQNVKRKLVPVWAKQELTRSVASVSNAVGNCNNLIFGNIFLLAVYSKTIKQSYLPLLIKEKNSILWQLMWNYCNKL